MYSGLGMGGYGSYGSSYGGYGGSYGSYGSYGRGLNTQTSTTTNNAIDVSKLDPQQKKKYEQAQNRKLVFQEWFKMLGGLRSILQLGFALIALVNFYGKSKQLIQKFFQFTKTSTKQFFKFIQSKFPNKIVENLSSPLKRQKTIKSILMILCRIFLGMIAIVGFKMRKQIKTQVKKLQQQKIQQLQLLKKSEVQMDQQEIDEQGMIVKHKTSL